MGYPYDSHVERGLSLLSRYLPARGGLVVPDEPDQYYLLGSRFADFGLAFVFALLFPLVRALLTRFIYRPLGQSLMQKQLKKSDVPQSAEKLRKWTESSWKMTVFTDSAYFWVGCTKFPPCNLYVGPGVLFFYCMQTGFYAQAIHYLVFIETRRKDWLESMCHHVVTLGLLVYSYYVNFTRVGIMIMLIHDISDIFLECAKLGIYMKFQKFADGMFGVFFVSWVLLRVLYFPIVIIRSTLIDPIELVAKPYDIDPHWHHVAFNALLITLFILHLYWSYLILLILIRALSGKAAVEDSREEDE